MIGIVLVLIVLLMNAKQRCGMLVMYILFIFGITLLFRESGNANHNFSLFWSYRKIFYDRYLAIEVLSNIWLFIPFGAILASLKQKPQVLLIAVGMSVLIEVSQLTFGLGFCEFDDIIGNSFGTWLGFGCFCEGMECKRKLRNGRKPLKTDHVGI